MIYITSSVDASSPTILWPWDRIPGTTPTLFSINIWIVCEKDENKTIKGRDMPFILSKRYNKKVLWKRSLA